MSSSDELPLLLDIYNPKKRRRLRYRPASRKHLAFHEANEDNVILIGDRGSAKSWALRHDAHMRALQWPGFTYALIRRTVPQLRKTHIRYLYREADALAASFNATNNEFTYHNGSVGYYFSCDDESGLENVLGADFGALYIDEMPTIPWEWIVQLGSAVRVAKGSPYKAIVRGGGNPIGTSAKELQRYYDLKTVSPDEDPEYDAAQYRMIRVRMGDNPYLDTEKYRRRFAGLPAHIRKAWLDGEWSFAGIYFEDFNPAVHVLDTCPPLAATKTVPAPLIYRAVDWGWAPDPAVCLWIAVYTDGHEVVFKEREWHRHTAESVAKAIAWESEGLSIRTTFCDPTMFKGERELGTSFARVFGQHGIPLTPSRNDRTDAGLAIHEHLGRRIEGDVPRMQIYGAGAPRLIDQLQSLQPHDTDPMKIGDGDDHSVIALAYFAMGDIRKPLGRVEQLRTEQLIHDQIHAAARLGSESARLSYATTLGEHRRGR